MMYCATKIKLSIGEFKALVFCNTPAEAEALTKYFKENHKADVKFNDSPFELEEQTNE